MVLERQLRAHPLVRGMSDRDLALLLAHAEVAQFEANQPIFASGDPADTFYLVRSGMVALRVAGDGGEPRRIQSIREGSALGWSWLFPPYEWQFEAVAETLTRAIAIDAIALRAEFEDDPGFGYRLMARIAEVMAKRLHATRRQVISLMGH